MAENRNEAAKWFAVRRRGLMSAEEREAFAAWRGASANAAALDAMERIWRDLEPNAEASTVSPQGLPRSARVAAMLSAASLMAGLVYRLDGSWWTTLDWWSR